jgi:hypothetical protein
MKHTKNFKIVFLDIDGVLNLMRPERDEFGSLFHEVFVENLKLIIDETDAKIVISSTWKMDGLQKMQDMWNSRNLPGIVIGITPNGYNIFINDFIRGDEIKAWLDKNPTDNYVIIDDDNDMLEEQMKYFVQTSNNPEHFDSLDIGYGLTKQCAKQAIDILNTQ